MPDTIQAKELIKRIKEERPTATVEDDEDCYVTPAADIDVDDDGECTLNVWAATPDMAFGLGNFCVTVGEVEIVVSRGENGPLDDFEFTGPEIVYGEGATQEDLIQAIKENVTFPPMEDFIPLYNETDFDSDDVTAALEVDSNAVFAKDADGTVYQYDSAEAVPAGQTIVTSDEAVSTLVDHWAENGGDVNY